MEETYYKIIAVCQNCCGKEELLEIPKGVTASSFMAKKTCELCGIVGRFALVSGYGDVDKCRLKERKRLRKANE